MAGSGIPPSSARRSGPLARPSIALTEVGLAAQLLPMADHALAQQALGLWVARVLHLPPDLGHRVEHRQLGP